MEAINVATEAIKMLLRRQEDQEAAAAGLGMGGAAGDGESSQNAPRMPGRVQAMLTDGSLPLAAASGATESVDSLTTTASTSLSTGTMQELTSTLEELKTVVPALRLMVKLQVAQFAYYAASSKAPSTSTKSSHFKARLQAFYGNTPAQDQLRCMLLNVKLPMALVAARYLYSLSPVQVLLGALPVLPAWVQQHPRPPERAAAVRAAGVRLCGLAHLLLLRGGGRRAQVPAGAAGPVADGRQAVGLRGAPPPPQPARGAAD